MNSADLKACCGATEPETIEIEGFGIGFMALTDDVNSGLLNDCFELAAFHGLCKPNENDVLQPVKSGMDDEEEDEDDVVISKEGTTLTSKGKLNSQVSIFSEAPPEIKKKLSDAGILET